MKVEQIYTGCLAHGAYYIESKGEVAIIDPLREVQPYIDMAEKNNAKIKYIFETHFHADFVSGHITLAEKTGATIVYGPTAKPSFDAHIATDNEEFKVGDVTIIALHTPGHTMESTTYLLRDEKGKDYSIFTGDTLFLGDVGRPDLAQKVGEITQEDLAGWLYDSIRTKLMVLDDSILVYPGHGAGSACGKNMMDETIDTLGHQKSMNYALRADMTREEFIAEVTEGLTPPPGYFPMNVKMNKEGYESIDTIMEKGSRPLSPAEFEAAANETEAIILDVRHEKDFVKDYVPNSIFIGIDGNFAPWVGAMIVDVKQPILLVAPEGRIEEAITRLSRVGFDNVLGYLKGGVEAWKAAGKETDQMPTISADEFADNYHNEKPPVVDVRRDGEFKVSHVEDALHIPLDYINDHMAEIPRDKDFYIHCAGGYRSVIAGSILKARGIHNLINIADGYSGITKTDIPFAHHTREQI